MSSSEVPWNPFRQNTSRTRSSASSGLKLRGRAIAPIYALTARSQRAAKRVTKILYLQGLRARLRDRDGRRRLPAEQDALVEPADRHQHQPQAHERQRAVD